MKKSVPGLTRALGLFDLSFFLIAALVNLNSVPVVAGSGPSALFFWVAGFVLFFLPQSVAVLELSSRYPQEGGIYNWNKTAFGDFHGFISGWCYWTNNIFYVPTLLFYIVGFSAFIGGTATEGLSGNSLVMGGLALGLLWVITVLNVLGLGVGKWVQNLGALGTFITTAVIVVIGVIAVHVRGMANPVTPATILPNFADWRVLSLFSIVCLNYVGLELGSVLGDEIKDPRRNMPRAALVAGVTTVLLYFLTTFSLQAALPAKEIGVIDGILQGVKRVTSEINLPWLLIPIAVLMSMNAAGNTSAWLAGSARIPFVIGLDRYLPSALGRIHPRYKSPHVSLVVQGIASSLFIIITAIGSSVHDMYLVLLQTTIVLQLIPYLYMFAALIRIRMHPDRYEAGEGFFRRSWLCYAGGGLGLLMTAAGVVFAFLPSEGVADVWNFEIKLLLGTLGFLVPAILIYRYTSKRLKSGIAVPEHVEPAAE